MKNTIQLSPVNSSTSTDSDCTVTIDPNYICTMPTGKTITAAKSPMVFEGIPNVTVTAPSTSSGSYYLASSGWINANTLVTDTISDTARTVEKLQEQVKSLQYGQDQIEKNVDFLSELTERLDQDIHSIIDDRMDMLSQINTLSGEIKRLHDFIHMNMMPKFDQVEKNMREEKAFREGHDLALSAEIKDLKLNMNLVKAKERCQNDK